MISVFVITAYIRFIFFIWFPSFLLHEVFKQVHVEGTVCQSGALLDAMTVFRLGDSGHWECLSHVHDLP